jgi:K+-transporting ATPase ATPase A chain
MSANAWGLLALYLVVLLATAWPLGLWLARLADGRIPNWMRRVEAPLYRLAGTDPDKSMHWAPSAPTRPSTPP